MCRNLTDWKREGRGVESWLLKWRAQGKASSQAQLPARVQPAVRKSFWPGITLAGDARVVNNEFHQSASHAALSPTPEEQRFTLTMLVSL